MLKTKKLTQNFFVLFLAIILSFLFYNGQWAQWSQLDLAAPGSIPSNPPKNIRGKYINIAEVNRHSWFEETGQQLENVDLVLIRGKPVQQKN